jgi:hypothetical protein
LREEVNQDREVLAGEKVGLARIADERVGHNGSLIINGQLHFRFKQELSPERLKVLWDLHHAGQTVGSQRRDHLVYASADTVPCNHQEKLLTSKLIISMGSVQVGDELIATCKKVANEQQRKLK